MCCGLSFENRTMVWQCLLPVGRLVTPLLDVYFTYNLLLTMRSLDTRTSISSMSEAI
jgi:hypothetical protein